ncbi:uncharacterized protein LOC114373569 [Glycine soja]|uniref:uncharacterized protein LOC114373569 n=1 Tax=Glycine soja TaxID=3848 RepID=UPI0010407A8F|nr:uncharacterized protein LOC114373569 [Glycine soja]
MVEREMVTMMVDTLPVFYYEKLVGYMPSSFAGLAFAGERIEVGLKRGKFDYVSPVGANSRRTEIAGTKKKEGDAHTVTSTPAWPKPPQIPYCTHQYAQHHLSFSAHTEWYNPSATCAYHGGTPGHLTEQFFALKSKIQSLIEAWWLTFQEDGPNIKTNPLANHGGGAVNAIEVSRLHWPKLLEDVKTPRRFIYKALQKVGMIPCGGHREDSCLMHPGVPHDMETCSAIRDLLQWMIDQGRLEVGSENQEEQHVYMQSADVEGPKKPKPLVIYFTRNTAPQRPQHPSAVSGGRSIPFSYKNNHVVPWRYASLGGRKEEAIDISSLSAKVTNITRLSGITRSGRVFGPPSLPIQPANTKGKARMTEGQNVKVFPAPDEDVPTKDLSEGREGCGKKEVSLEEAGEFLRIIHPSEFKVIQQLNKTPARVSLLELLMSSKPHRALLVKVLNEAHVAQDIYVEGFGGIVNNIIANNYLTFAEEEIPTEGRGHNRALHASVKYMEHVMAKVLIDNGSSLNVMPKSTRQKVSGEIDLPVQIGPHTCQVTFHVMDINPTYSYLLGHPWIHSVGVVPSTLHQKLKFVVEGHLVIVSGEEDVLVSCPSSMPYVEAAEESLETAFQYFELLSIASIDSLSRQPRLSDSAMMVARVMLGHGYEP